MHPNVILCEIGCLEHIPLCYLLTYSMLQQPISQPLRGYNVHHTLAMWGRKGLFCPPMGLRQCRISQHWEAGGVGCLPQGTKKQHKRRQTSFLLSPDPYIPGWCCQNQVAFSTISPLELLSQVVSTIYNTGMFRTHHCFRVYIWMDDEILFSMSDFLSLIHYPSGLSMMSQMSGSVLFYC